MRCDAENLLPNHFFEPWPINCRQGPLEIKDTDSECIVKTMCSERSDTCLNSTYTVPEVLTLVPLYLTHRLDDLQNRESVSPEGSVSETESPGLSIQEGRT